MIAKPAYCIIMTQLPMTLDSIALSSYTVKEESLPTPAASTAGYLPAESLNPDSDESLLTKVGGQQCKAAFNTLFDRFANRIFAHGMKITRNEQLSKDLVQEAMLIVWQKAPLYDISKGNAQSWIFTITRNRCFDILRKLKRQPNFVSADDIWSGESSEIESCNIAENDFIDVEFVQIKKFLLQLPAAQQAVVEQIYLYDKTHEEAAAILQIPLGTLKSRLRLAMGKLRQLIGTEND